MNALNIESQLKKIFTGLANKNNFVQVGLIEKTDVISGATLSHSFTLELILPQVEKPIFFGVFFRVENGKVENNAVISFKRDTLFYPYVAYTKVSESLSDISFIDLFGDGTGLDMEEIRKTFEKLLPYMELLKVVSKRFNAEIVVPEFAIEFGNEYKMLAS